MAKPASVPTWASETNYAGGSEYNTATKATPSATLIGQGLQASAGINHQHLNWCLNLIGSWLTWVDGFLAESHTWTGAHTWTPGTATANGVTATGNTSGSGVKGTGGASNGLGCEGIGTGSGAGVKGTGGATGIGVEGVGTGSGAGVKATGGATGNGLYVVANAAKANILLGSTGGSDPSTLENGTIWYDGTDIWCRAGGATFKLNA